MDDHPKALLTLSMKGGVGKTTVAVGLARGLARRGLQVGLLDVDIHGSALPRALKLSREPGYEPLVGQQLRPVRDGNIQVFSVGLLFREESPTEWDGEQKRSGVKQLVTGTVAWETLDWLVVDTPPTSGDEVLSLLTYTPNIHGAVIVTQPSDLSTLGMRKTINLLREERERDDGFKVPETPIVGVLVNMSGFHCPHCHQLSTVFDQALDASEEICDRLGVPHLGYIPFASEEERAERLEPVVDRVLSGKVARLTDPVASEHEGLVEKGARWLLSNQVR